MKAKVKTTGEIINVYISGYGNFSNDTNPTPKLEPIYKEVEWSSESYRECSLDFSDTIDWEQRRYEIAKDVLAYCATYKGDFNAVKHAVVLADALIEELKKKDKQ